MKHFELSIHDSKMEALNDVDLEQSMAIKLNDGKKVFIIDGLIELNAMKPIFHYFQQLPYTFNEGDRPDLGKMTLTHFVHYFEEKLLKDENAIKPLIENIYSILDRLGLPYVPEVNRAYLSLTLFGDFQHSHIDGDEWTAIYFMTDEWKEDWMGELFINDPSEMVQIGITPKPGRLVVFDGTIHHRGGVPSRLCYKPRIALVIKIRR